MTIKETKENLKARAAAIKAYNLLFKQCQRDGTTWTTGRWQDSVPGKAWTPECNSTEFRHLHIAYCMARGTAYEKIEPKVLPGNEPDWKKIEAYRAQIDGVSHGVQTEPNVQNEKQNSVQETVQKSEPKSVLHLVQKLVGLK